MNDERFFKKILAISLCPVYFLIALCAFIFYGVDKVCAQQVSHQFTEIYDITSGVGGNLYTGYNYIRLTGLRGHTLRIGTSDIFTGDGEGHIQLEIQSPLGGSLDPNNPFRMYYYDGSMNKIYLNDDYFSPASQVKSKYDVYFPVNNVNTKCNVYLELNAYLFQTDDLVIRISGSVTVNEVLSDDENTQNVIDNQNQNTQNIINNQNQNTQNIINNQNQNNQNVINNNNQNTDNIINNQNNNFNDLNNNINNQFNTCKDIDIKNTGYWFAGFVIGEDGNYIELTGLSGKLFGTLNNINIKGYESVTIDGLTNFKYFVNTYDKNENYIRTITNGNQTITITPDEYYMAISMSRNDYDSKLSLTGKKCGNRIDETNDKLDQLQESQNKTNDYIMDDTPPEADISELGNVSGLLPPGPVDSLLNIPFNFLSILTSSFGGVCKPIEGKFVFDSTLSIPCFSSLFYDKVPSALMIFLDIVPTAFMLISYFKHLYKKIERATSMETNSDDEWGVI